MFKFTVPGNPVGKGRVKQGRWSTYTPDKTVTYEAIVAGAFAEKYKNIKPLETALKLDLYIFMQVPKSTSNKKKEEMLSGKIRPTKKPDTSNILKAVEDALNTVAYVDDCQFVEEHEYKFYSDRPRLEVVIQEISY